VLNVALGQVLVGKLPVIRFKQIPEDGVHQLLVGIQLGVGTLEERFRVGNTQDRLLSPNGQRDEGQQRQDDEDAFSYTDPACPRHAVKRRITSAGRAAHDPYFEQRIEAPRLASTAK